MIFPKSNDLSIQTRRIPFPYKFRYVKGSEKDAPTIIFLPGGPGETSIIPSPLNPEFPTTFSIIWTDPRGVGCNDSLGGIDPLESFSTDYLASDILGVIGYLQLQNYILYGRSYGTQLATVVASRTSSNLIPPPKAVVLEATIGRALTTQEHFQDGFLRQWQQASSRLPPEILQLLSADKPLGYSAEEWGNFIAMMLMAGYKPKQSDSLQRWLGASAFPDKPQPSFREFFALFTQKPSKQQEALYKTLMCREMTTDLSGVLMEVQFKLFHGNLIPDTKSICGDLSVDRPYNSAQWQIAASIFYFQGEKDPDIPPGHAKYHFDNQTAARRYLLPYPKDPIFHYLSISRTVQVISGMRLLERILGVT